MARQGNEGGTTLSNAESVQRALLAQAREKFHTALLDSILTVDKEGIPSNADRGSRPSILIASGITSRLKSRIQNRVSGQESGKTFEVHCASFINDTFLELSHLRPGDWNIIRTGRPGRRRAPVIADYEQYAHLAALKEATESNPELAAILGTGYTITPDILVIRNLVKDNLINKTQYIVDSGIANKADIREVNGGKPLLHASISAKWTIRSDRSQSSRSEALNLVRNRKGRLPHIVVVTGEPMPSRLASIALGTGDIDCVYHFALDELRESVSEAGYEDSEELLNIMVDGKRLKDISDLPLDLAV